MFPFPHCQGKVNNAYPEVLFWGLEGRSPSTQSLWFGVGWGGQPGEGTTIGKLSSVEFCWVGQESQRKKRKERPCFSQNLGWANLHLVCRKLQRSAQKSGKICPKIVRAADTKIWLEVLRTLARSLLNNLQAVKLFVNAWENKSVLVPEFMHIWQTLPSFLKEGRMHAGRAKKKGTVLQPCGPPGNTRQCNHEEEGETGNRGTSIQAEESILVRNLRELGRQWVTTSYLICTGNLEQNQSSSENWPVTWRIMKREMLLIQKAADVILQKPGTGKKRQLNSSLPSGGSCELLG